MKAKLYFVLPRRPIFASLPCHTQHFVLDIISPK